MDAAAANILAVSIAALKGRNYRQYSGSVSVASLQRRNYRQFSSSVSVASL
jgi:hypothetical protein